MAYFLGCSNRCQGWFRQVKRILTVFFLGVVVCNAEIITNEYVHDHTVFQGGEEITVWVDWDTVTSQIRVRMNPYPDNWYIQKAGSVGGNAYNYNGEGGKPNLNKWLTGQGTYEYVRITTLNPENLTQYKLEEYYDIDANPPPPFDPDDPEGPQCGAIDWTGFVVNDTPYQQKYLLYWWIEPDGQTLQLDPLKDDTGAPMEPIVLEGYTKIPLTLYYEKARWPIAICRLDEYLEPIEITEVIYPTNWQECENFTPDPSKLPDEIPPEEVQEGPTDAVDIEDTRYQQILDDPLKSDLAKDVETEYLMMQELKAKLGDIEDGIEGKGILILPGGEVVEEEGTFNPNVLQVEGYTSVLPGAPNIQIPLKESVISVNLDIPNVGTETITVDLADYSAGITAFRTIIELALGLLAFWYTITIIRGSVAG